MLLSRLVASLDAIVWLTLNVHQFLELARLSRPSLRPEGRTGASQHINHISDTFPISRRERRRWTTAGISHAAVIYAVAAAALNSMTWSAALFSALRGNVIEVGCVMGLSIYFLFEFTTRRENRDESAAEEVVYNQPRHRARIQIVCRLHDFPRGLCQSHILGIVCVFKPE